MRGIITEREIAINQPRASYFVGGAEVVSLKHTKALLELGHRARFYTLKPDSIGQEYTTRFLELKELEDSNGDQLRIVELDQDPRALDIYNTMPGEDKSRWYTEAMFHNRVLFETLVRDEPPVDVLLSYYQFDALAVPTNVRQNILYLCGIPSTENNLRTSQLAMYDQLFAINDKVKDYWQQFDQREIQAVTTGVDIPKSTSEKRENKDILSIVFAGRLIERKGCADLVTAIANLPADSRAKAHLTIIGDGPQREALERLAADKGLASQVSFEGTVDNPSDYFATADMCVFPSLRGEGLMGVVLEAMATGACVVSTYDNGNETLLGDMRGVLYEPGDIDALHKIIDDLSKDGTRRYKLGKAALAHVESNYNWAAKTAELLGKIT